MGRVHTTAAVMAACLLICAPQAGAAQDAQEGKGDVPAVTLTEGSLTAHTLPPVTVYGVADRVPSTPTITKFGTQYNTVTEDQIKLQGSLDFYDALRNVPGVMFRKSNIIGGQTSHSVYIRGRGASHPSPDLPILFDGVPRSGVLYGQALADGIPVYALGGMEIYKSPQPTRFGSGYGMINFIPKYMTEDGFEFRVGFQGGSYGTFAENAGMGAKSGPVDVYAAQSWMSTTGHKDHTAAYQASYYLNTGYALTDNWNVRLLANEVGAKTQSPLNPYDESKYSGAERYDTDTDFLTLTLNNDYDVAKGYLKGYYNYTTFYLNGESNDTATSRQRNILYGVRGRETLNLWKGSEIVVGFDLDVSDLQNKQDKFAPGATDTTWDFPSHTMFSPYLGISQTFGRDDGFHITPSTGLRLYTSNLWQDYVSPQAGLVLGYDHTNLAFSYARGVNYPSPVILQNSLGNKDLPGWLDTKEIKPEVVDHYEVSLTHEQPGLFNASATYFHDKGWDRFRAFMYGRLGAANYTDFFTSSASEYQIDGLELAGSVTPLDGLEIYGGATWLWARAKGDDGKTQLKMPYTPSFAFQGGFKYRFLRDFQFSGDYQHLEGVYSGTSMRTASPAQPASTFSRLTDNDRLNSIDVVNLRLDYFFSYDKLHLEEGRVFVGVDNLFDCKYGYTMEKQGSDHKLYYMPGTTFMAGFELKF